MIEIGPTRTYRTYGLSIRSPFALPELSPGEGDPDVTVTFGSLPHVPAPRTPGASYAGREGDAIRLRWETVGAFEVRAGREIVIDPVPEAEEGLIRACLLGTALATVLHQRGALVLHAGAIRRDDAVIAFAGPSGAGKSTMVAACLRAGHDLVADDYIPVAPDGTVIAGYPQVKLWPEAADSLGLDAGRMPALAPSIAKRALRLPDLAAPPLHLRHVYVLGEGPLAMVRLPYTAAVIALAGQTFAARAVTAEDEVSHFRRCAGIARSVPVSRLIRPHSLDHLDEVVAAISEAL